MDYKNIIKLIYVGAENNNNKYYHMIDTEDGYFRAEFGRVGAACQTKIYPISKWESTRKSKVRKGYRDVTELFAETVSDSIEFHDISDNDVKCLFTKLQLYAKKEIANNYTVTADSVTKKQIDEAQSILDDIVALSESDNVSVTDINNKLISLFMVIPRKMSDVKSHLLVQVDDELLDSVITKEQNLLDNMASQVKQVELVKENSDKNATILEAMGLDIRPATPEEEEMIKKKLDNIADRFVTAYRVVNNKTQKCFDEWMSKVDNKKCELFFHGSRNENWLSILENGLLLRPSNVVISGKMFGYGTYFADKAQKSLGYTSSRGSYWARGSSNEAFMALFEVHLGNSLEVDAFESWCSRLDESSLKKKGNYDSVFAKAGKSLRNNEFIVYNQNQANIKYLVQLRG
jgi:poly [ADP-ribose] polymerase